jgi:hypothetical protein
MITMTVIGARHCGGEDNVERVFPRFQGEDLLMSNPLK